MESKAIIFVGGVTGGVDKLKNYLRKSNKVWNYSSEKVISDIVGMLGIEKNSDIYGQAVEDMLNMSNTSFQFETLDTGKEIAKFLQSDAQYLIIHKSSDEIRATMSHIEDRVCNVFRIFFGYKNDLPCEFDFNINPNTPGFESIVERILMNEERISM